MKIYKKYIVFTLAAVLATAALFASLFLLESKEKAISASDQPVTTISGIAAETAVKLDMSYFVQDDDGAIQRRIMETQMIMADQHGQVALPPLAQAHDTYNLSYQGQDGEIKQVHFDLRHDEAILRVTANGFAEAEPIKVTKYDEAFEAKTDWSGRFSGDFAIQPSDFDSRSFMTFSFMGAIAPEQGRGMSPNIIQVQAGGCVVGAGGGPNASCVNVYNPPIGTCANTNGNPGDPRGTIFIISTCDVGRMNQHLVPSPPDAPGTIETNYVWSLMKMTEQLSAVMMQQMMILGSLFDARIQNETQREFRKLVAEAHKDYHPSEQLCQYGSFTRSISHSEERASLNKKALSEILSTYYTQQAEAGSASQKVELEARIEQFRDTYCDPNDMRASLWLMCDGTHYDADDVPNPSGASDAERDRYNRDIDYFRTVDKPRTIPVVFDDNALGADDVEEDIITLAKNLYWPVIHHSASGLEQYGPTPEDSDIYDAREQYLATRAIVAKKKIAHNTFTNIVGMKSQSEPSTPPEEQGGAFMKSLLRDFNFPLGDAEIEEFLGENPSYYAQMDMLTKIMYQHPNFYTNLYDKPVNVDRMVAAMEAIQLMHARDRHDSLLRQEMLISLLVEQGLRKHVDIVNQKLLDRTKTNFPEASTGFSP